MANPEFGHSRPDPSGVDPVLVQLRLQLFSDDADAVDDVERRGLRHADLLVLRRRHRRMLCRTCDASGQRASNG